MDDCGQDNSMEICDRLSADYQGPIRFKVLHHDHNRGLSAARNTGTDAATGEWIFYLDSDDELSPDAIALLVAETDKHTDIEMVVGNVISDSDQDFYNLRFETYPYRIIQNNQLIRYLYFKPQNVIPVVAWNKLIRKEFLKNNGIIFKDGIIHEDELWTFQIIKNINSISLIEERTYNHHSRSGSIMRTIDKFESAKNWTCILNEMTDRIDQPFADLQLMRIITKTMDIYHLMKGEHPFNKLLNKVGRSLIRCKKIKLFIYFELSQLSNQIFQKFCYYLLPDIYKKTDLTINNQITRQQ